MTPDAELSAWQREWRDQPLPAISSEELARSVQRGTRTARRWVAAAALLTVLAVVPMLWRLWRHEADGRLVAGLLMFVALVWVSTLLIARGTWRARDESTAAFLEVSIRRCRAAVLGAPVGIVLYVAELVYVLIAVHRLEGADWGSLLRAPWMIVSGYVVGPIYVGGQLWYAFSQRARLARLRELQATL